MDIVLFVEMYIFILINIHFITETMYIECISKTIPLKSRMFNKDLGPVSKLLYLTFSQCIYLYLSRINSKK